MLADVRAAGSRTYNGRARRTVKRLEELGLVEAEWDMDLVTKGGGASTLWRITVTPKRGLRLGEE